MSPTLPVTLDEMVMLTRAVARSVRRAIVVADMPFGSFQVSEEEAVRNAVRLIKEGGADAVKLEGAGRTLTPVSAIVGAGIPGHGSHRAHTAVSNHAGRLQAAGPHGLGSAGALRRRCCARTGRVLLHRSRSDAGAGCGADHGTARRFRRLESARARRATVRCSSGTICWGFLAATFLSS